MKTTLMDMNNDRELYNRQFENKNKLVGQIINEIIFYLDDTDKDFTEQPNKFGKSLLNGFDIKTGKEVFSIGNRYTDVNYGLSIDIGRTDEIEFIELKKPIPFVTTLKGQTIKQIDIYWMKLPYENATGLYPQEIEIYTDKEYFLVSSIEINNGEVNTEFTNELLIIDNKDTARQLKLGQFGIGENGRLFFENFREMTK